MITIFLLTLVVGLFIKYLWDRKRAFGQLENIGIPGPPPNFWNGNVKERTAMGLLPMIDHFTEKYGNVWGYYEGTKATVVVSDVEIMKEIYIKEFSKFHSRKLGFFSEDEYRSVFDSHDLNQWKRLRSIGSPSFSALRMKEMSPLINVSVDNLMELFEERCKDGKAFNIHRDWQKMTMETIGSCAFGMDVDSIKNPDSPFLLKCRGFFEEAEKLTPLASITAMLIFTMPAVLKVPVLSDILSKAFNTIRIRAWFRETAKKMIIARKQDGKKRIDFIQLMLDANETEDTSGSAVELEMKVEDEDENGKVTSSNDNEGAKSTRMSKHMTLKEMQGNCFVMLIAGYETTSTALGFASYELALNPEVQKKLQAEIDEHFSDKKCQPNYTTVQKMQYLDMFISELLRRHTIAAAASTRHCHETCCVGGYTIKAGMQIQMNLEAVHMNPDLWGPEDPEEFIPERFLPERNSTRHPIAWIPFGGGPRNCIGMRFALMELKIALVRILKNYNIERTAETQVPIQKQKRLIRGPAAGVFVKLTSRD